MEFVDITIGIDIGQQRDPTAIAVTELKVDPVSLETRYLTRFLERLPLGTPYPKIAERLTQIVSSVEAAVRQEYHQVGTIWTSSVEAQAVVTTYVDATGVGKPVVDLIRETGLDLVECYFTHGDRRTVNDGRVTIGKAWLVSRLQALLQSQRLVFPAKHPEAQSLTNELLDYEIRVDQNANDRYGAFRVGTHDDLVTAVGLAAQVTPPDIRWTDDVIAAMNAEMGL